MSAWTRRRFLQGCGLSAGLTLLAGRAQAAAPLRIAFVQDPGGSAPESTARGLLLAEGEAQRQASLLRRPFELLRTAEPLPAAVRLLVEQGAQAVLVDADPRSLGDLASLPAPILALRPGRGEPVPQVFQLATPLRARLRALVAHAGREGLRRWSVNPSDPDAPELARNLDQTLRELGGERLDDPTRADVVLRSGGPGADGAAPSAGPVHAFLAEPRPAPLRSRWIVDWHPDLTRYGAEQVNRRFRDRFAMPMDESAWLAWIGLKCCVEAALRARVVDGAPAPLALPHIVFDGHKGERLCLRDDGFLVQPVYLVGTDEGAPTLLGELPSPLPRLPGSGSCNGASR